MPFLKKVGPEPSGQLFEIRTDSFVIGRLQDCHVVLDPNGISRKHTEIRRTEHGWVVADLHSRNFTYLNGRKIEPDLPPPLLAANDRIKICEVEFVYYDVVPKEPAPASSRRTDEIHILEGLDEVPGALHSLDASRSSSMASAVKPEVKLRAIIEISRSLTSELKIDTVAPKIIDSLMELFPQAERGFLILIDPANQRLIRKAFKYRPHRRSFTAAQANDEVPMSISRSIVRHVIEMKKAILSQDAGADMDLPTSASIAELKIRSVLCVPLLTPDGNVLGIIQLDTSDRRQFLQEDLDVLAAVAGQAAVAVQNATMHEKLLKNAALERDLAIAETVQKGFLPQATPQVPGFEFFAYYQPTFEVGGDYYDFMELPGDRLGIALGDVSGKGVAAALMMAKFSGETRFCVSTEAQPCRAVGKLNNAFCSAGIAEKFMTMTFCLLDIPRSRLTVCSAGHPAVMVRRADGRVEEIGDEVRGFALGVMPDWVYEQTEVDLRPGDVVVLYSDGVTDARSPAEELYETMDNRRLLRRVTESAGRPGDVGRSILQSIREFSLGRRQFDDITLVCFGPAPARETN